MALVLEPENNEPRMVYLRWRDASFSVEEIPVNATGLVTLEEIGWLVREDEECVVISCEMHEEDGESTRGSLSVPKVNIQERHDAAHSDLLRWLRRRAKK